MPLPNAPAARTMGRPGASRPSAVASARETRMRIPHPLFAAALGWVLAAAGPGSGQTPGLSYDPSSPIHLLTSSPAVRDELKLREAQLAKVRDLAGAAVRDEAEVWEKLGGILDAGQAERLRGVSLQLRGGTALALPEIAKALDLTVAQQKEFVGLRAAAVRDIEKALKSVRFPSEQARRGYVLKALRAAGEPMLKTLTDRQREAFERLQGPAVDADKLFGRPK